MGSWSSGGNLNTARKAVAGCGTQTAGLSFGGHVSAVSDVTEFNIFNAFCDVLPS